MNTITNTIYALINKSDAYMEKAAAAMAVYENTGEPSFLRLAKTYTNLSTNCNKTIQIMMETSQEK